jgi:predicted MFS family arabinose efflux permease
MACCLGAGAALLACLAVVTGPAGYLVAAVLCAGVLGTANALTLIATQAVVKPERAGEASGVTKTIITVAAGLGVALAGDVAGPDTAATETATRTVLLTTSAGCLTFCLALTVWIRTRKPTTRRATSTANSV